MACCKYCSFGKQDDKESTTYVSVDDFERERISLRREIEHVKVCEAVDKELIRELQERVEQLQDRVLETWYYLCQVRVPMHSTGSYYVPQSEKGPFCQNITQRFLDWQIYHDYLVGDYEDETVDKGNKGYQSDEDIEDLVDVMPKEMQKDPHTAHNSHPRSWTATASGPVSGVTAPRSSPWDHLTTSDDDKKIRTEERKDVKYDFMSIGNEHGSGESDFDELLNMVKNGSAEEKKLAEEILRKMFSEGVKDTDDGASDMNEQGG